MERVGHIVFDHCLQYHSCSTHLTAPSNRKAKNMSTAPTQPVLKKKPNDFKNAQIAQRYAQEKWYMHNAFHKNLLKCHWTTPKLQSQYGKTECCLHAWLWYIKAITLLMCGNPSCTLTNSNQMYGHKVLNLGCPHSKQEH